MKQFFSGKKFKTFFHVFLLQEGKKIFLLEREHLNFTCTFCGTMKRISREFYGDLSGNRCTKVCVGVPGCQYI